MTQKMVEFVGGALVIQLYFNNITFIDFQNKKKKEQWEKILLKN